MPLFSLSKNNTVITERQHRHCHALKVLCTRFSRRTIAITIKRKCLDFGNATRGGKSNFFFPREQMSHPLGNIHVQSKMRRHCPTDWTWQWAPLTQPRIGFLKPGQLPSARLPNHFCLEGPVSLSLLSLCHCRQVLWTAVVTDMWVQTIFGCSATTFF